MMGGLDTPTSGTVIVRGEELARKNDEQLTIFRRRNIGFIFQNYNLVPILNVYENIALPVELDGDTVDQRFLDEIVHLLGLENGGRTDLAYMDEQAMSFLGFELVNGKLPQSNMEVLVSETYLSIRKLELGDTFSFEYVDTLTNEVKESSFTICGIIQNETQEKGKQFYISVINSMPMYCLPLVLWYKEEPPIDAGTLVLFRKRLKMDIITEANEYMLDAT